MCSLLFSQKPAYFLTLAFLFIFLWLRFFEWNSIAKWVVFFASFCWLWEFLLENLKLKDKLQIWGFE